MTMTMTMTMTMNDYETCTERWRMSYR